MNPRKDNNIEQKTNTRAIGRGRDACTIFIRNISPSLTRLELEEYFSEIGPVRKCSLISDSTKQHQQDGDDGSQRRSRYGFVKFCNENDASRAVQEHNESKNSIKCNKLFNSMILELADSNANRNKTKKKDSQENQANVVEETAEQIVAIQQKQTARVIVRNLSFYATDAHIRKTMSQFGPIVDIHLPMVPLLPSSSDRHKQQHRGFAFVTFENSNQAQRAVSSKSLTIKNRPVLVELSISKHHHQQKQQQLHNSNNSQQNEQHNMDEESHSTNTASTASHSNSDDDRSTSSNSHLADNSQQDQQEEDTTSIDQATTTTTTASNGIIRLNDIDADDVKEQRTLFVRNIPFDANRHSLFLLFKQFGKLEAIFLVKDKVTHVCKGTAFVKFATKEACARALMKSGRAREDAPFIVNSTMQQEEEEGIFFQGRRLLVDLALDKEQASTLVAERDPETGQVLKKQIGKDRRNLYLKQEGHIPTNTLLWDSLPIIDQEKRLRASSEKSTKLKSPIFFINPLRLSVRNLGKHVTKKGLKSLAVTCTQEGLRNGLVTMMDVTAQLRAQGILSPRDCVSEEFCHIPAFDTQNIKKYIPSVFVNISADNDKKKDDKTKVPSTPSSKGFGFIEFAYHAHALACLRELNNNDKYSKEWAFKGKASNDNKRNGSNMKRNKSDPVHSNDATKVSRIIVEFTVENRVKAKQQADRRAQLLLHPNPLSEQGGQQCSDPIDGEAKGAMKKKKGRGSITREKKRKKREEAADIMADVNESNAVHSITESSKMSSRNVEEEERPAKMMKKAPKKRKGMLGSQMLLVGDVLVFSAGLLLLVAAHSSVEVMAEATAYRQ
mmetsp:Transcript_2781/g.4209  ORF Transcript_2781/g.4209 Transcript_2781/m.4209 type:complete len:839 (+) Transcript_2781:82-2598(+)